MALLAVVQNFLLKVVGYLLYGTAFDYLQNNILFKAIIKNMPDNFQLKLSLSQRATGMSTVLTGCQSRECSTLIFIRVPLFEHS